MIHAPAPGLRMLALLAVLASWFSATSTDDCPLTCTAVPTGMPGGTSLGPPGTSLSILFGAVTNGKGKEDPCQPCPGFPCKEETGVVWQNNGTNWCLRYTYGAFTSGLLKEYSRGGSTSVHCDDFISATFDVVDCDTGAVGFTGTRTLHCNCP